VTGVDRNPRALRFAQFNAAVNGIENATFVLGDLYAPLGDAQFDAILANPPFVPRPLDDDAELQYRGGGARGDDVVARIFAGAIAHLEPGGTLAVVADFADADELPERIRDWQGEARRTLILLQHRAALLAYAETHAAHLDDRVQRQAEVVRLVRHFHAASIRTLDFGYVVQAALPGSTQVERTTAALAADVSGEVAAWFAHQRQIDDGDADEFVLAPELRLVEVAERDADGRVEVPCYLAPGPASFYEARPVSRAAFGLLIRAAAGRIRAAEVTDPEDARELAALVARGLLRITLPNA
jgi:carbamoyltransferase